MSKDLTDDEHGGLLSIRLIQFSKIPAPLIPVAGLLSADKQAEREREKHSFVEDVEGLPGLCCICVSRIKLDKYILE